MQRGEEAWLVDLAGGTETRLPVSGKWGFAQYGPGDDLYFVELVSKVDTTYTSRLLRVNAAARAEIFTFDSGGWWLGWAASVSPDRSAVAYLDRNGVRLHILASGQDLQIVSNERSGCPGSRNCYGYYRVQWPQDGQHIIATRIEYEPSGTYAFEARFGAQDGVRLATVPGAGFDESDNLVVGGKYCTDGAANFGSPYEITVFDLLAQTGRKVGRPSNMRASACVMNARGEVAVQWEPDFAAQGPPRDSAAVFHDSTLEAGLAVGVPSTAKLYDWLPDRSGLVFRTTDIDPRFERTEPVKYLLLDRDGMWWDLPMSGDDLLAVLP